MREGKIEAPYHRYIQYTKDEFKVKYLNIYTSSINKAETRLVNLVLFGNNKVKAAKRRQTGIEDEKGRMQ